MLNGQPLCSALCKCGGPNLRYHSAVAHQILPGVMRTRMLYNRYLHRQSPFSQLLTSSESPRTSCRDAPPLGCHATGSLNTSLGRLLGGSTAFASLVCSLCVYVFFALSRNSISIRDLRIFLRTHSCICSPLYDGSGQIMAICHAAYLMGIRIASLLIICCMFILLILYLRIFLLAAL